MLHPFVFIELLLCGEQLLRVGHRAAIAIAISISIAIAIGTDGCSARRTDGRCDARHGGVGAGRSTICGACQWRARASRARGHWRARNGTSKGRCSRRHGGRRSFFRGHAPRVDNGMLGIGFDFGLSSGFGIAAFNLLNCTLIDRIFKKLNGEYKVKRP